MPVVIVLTGSLVSSLVFRGTPAQAQMPCEQKLAEMFGGNHQNILHVMRRAFEGHLLLSSALLNF